MLFAALAFCLLPGCVLLPSPAPRDYTTLAPADRPEHNLRVYDAAWKHVARGYYDAGHRGLDWNAARERHRAAAEAATSEDELYAAVNAMLAELDDDHTRAARPSDIRAEQVRERVLLGLILQPDDLAGGSLEVLVLQVMPGGAAAEAGVQAGWVLLSCDSRPPRDVLGPGKLTAGQVVTCEFRDQENTRRTLAIAARNTPVGPVIAVRELPDGSVYLRFDKFEVESERWLRDQLKSRPDATGVIVDLRFNPGGDAVALGRMLREFFPKVVDLGTFVSRRGFRFPLHVSSWFGTPHYTGPLVVLVSEYSASSSEIFAAVLQHHGRATIVGEKTAGAVLASRRFALPDGGRLQLSIDDYVSPGGTRLEGTGVTPDLVVPTTAEDLRASRDPVLEAAVRHLESKRSSNDER